MVTDRYQHVRNIPTAAALVVWAKGAGLPLIETASTSVTGWPTLPTAAAVPGGFLLYAPCQ